MTGSIVWGFDVDSVVGDLSTVLERVAWEVYGIRVSRAQFTEFRLERCLPYEPGLVLQWINLALEPEWTDRMEPYPGAIEVLTMLAESQELRFVTARPRTEPLRSWLRRHLPKVSPERLKMEAVGNSGSKVRALRQWGVTHFVDDHLETCVELNDHGIVPIVFEQPWNAGRHGFTTIRDWWEIGRWIELGEAPQEVRHA
ncbi:MAG: 5' nucleotidase, NT5C type [Thermodesulfobacteriota bacterium]